jgi:hypothetical protein
MSTSTLRQTPFPPSCAPNTERLRPHPGGHTAQNPSSVENQAGSIAYIPGDPGVDLLPGRVNRYLATQLETPLLDELYDKLWMVARKSGRSIDALHMQRVKGRAIIPIEDPRLHLIWYRNKIYIKPVPTFLLNHDFWTLYLQPLTKQTSTSSQETLQPAALSFDPSIAIGFLRSYALLVPQRLDFTIARETHLIPDEVDWLQWSKFIRNFRQLGDESVARRYHYGQLRLSRLNWVVRLFRPKQATTMWFYEIPYWSTTEFVARAALPLLFVFASVSLALSSMQVALSVPDGLWSRGPSWPGLQDMSRAFWIFSIAVLLLWAVIWVLLLGIPLAALVWQFTWGFTNREKNGTTCGLNA